MHLQTEIAPIEKQMRAELIKQAMQAQGKEKCVCFSCGNSSRALIEAGVDTLDISPSGPLIANQWWTPQMIADQFPQHFDGTSGHLPEMMMDVLAFRMRLRLGDDYFKPGIVGYNIPTGSGETITVLGMAYPDIKFIAVYDSRYPETTYSSSALLNDRVKKHFLVKHGSFTSQPADR